ncbi:MAG: SsrA-binding protein, partial [Cyanobacteria bacterium J06607_13]
MAKSSKSKDNGGGIKVVADNRQARYQYEILDTYEAGIVLTGTEVKSIREGKVNLRDGYANVKRAEVWLHNVHISPHSMTNLAYNHEPRRVR